MDNPEVNNQFLKSMHRSKYTRRKRAPLSSRNSGKIARFIYMVALDPFTARPIDDPPRPHIQHIFVPNHRQKYLINRIGPARDRSKFSSNSNDTIT